MKILALVYSFPPFMGGSGMGMYDLLKRMVNEDDITVITFNHGGAKPIEKMDGMRIYRLTRWQLAHIYPIPKPTLHNWWLLRKAVKGDYDIVYTRTRFFFTSFIGLIVSYLKGLPMLHTEPGTTYVKHQWWWVPPIAFLWDQTIGRLIAHHAECVGVSEAATAFIKKLGARNPVTIYNGVDRSIFYPPDEPPQNDVLQIMYAGRLMWTKGLDILNDVSDRMDGQVSISVAGFGPYKLHERITTLGQLAPQDLAERMRQSDLFILPSRMEGLSRAIQEAQCCGLPVIATDVGGNKELLDDGQEGYLTEVDAEDIIQCVNLLIEDNKQLNAMRQKAQERAAGYDWAKTVSEYRRVMKRMVN